MNSNQELENLEDFSNDFGLNDSMSVDDFIKQLEAKEKDLDISSDLVIEIDESEFDDKYVPNFLQPEIKVEDKKPKAEIEISNFSEDRNKVSALETKLTEMQSQVQKMEAERVEIFENSRRRHKDFENYKNRTERERKETFLNQVSNLATQMLPVLDNLNRALDFAIDIKEEKQSDFLQFFDGIVLVNQQLNEVLAGMGVQPITSIGQPFDPYFHEAVATEESDSFMPNTISAELLRGYRIGEKVIRPSMVKVAAPAKPKTFNNLEDNGDILSDFSIEFD